MTLSVKHKFQSLKPDGPDTSIVRPINWNDEHNISGQANSIVARAAGTAGAMSDVAVAGGFRVTSDGKINFSYVGEVKFITGTTAPSGTIKANGALLSRTTYADLWAFAQASGNIASTDAIWTSSTLWGQYSPGDGSTTFRIPDLRGYHLRCFDDGRGVDTARVMGSYQADTNLAHNHAISDPTHAHGVADPGHAHGVGDPGHLHGHAMYSGDGGRFDGFGGNGNPSYVGRMNCDAAGTGIWIGGAGVGIGIYGAGTGISIQNNGGTEARPKNVALLAVLTY